jgi:hypothetical protein
LPDPFAATQTQAEHRRQYRGSSILARERRGPTFHETADESTAFTHQEVLMGGAPVVIALGGLIFPILLLLAAILFDLAVVVWFLTRWWHDRIAPAFATVARGIAGHMVVHPVGGAGKSSG